LICVYWVNPLTWWAKRRLVHLSEQACDDWVVAAGQSQTDYADTLLQFVPQGRMTLVPTVIGGKNEMKKRIRRIIEDRREHPLAGRRWTGLILVLALGLALGLAFTQSSAVPVEVENPHDLSPHKAHEDGDGEHAVHEEHGNGGEEREAQQAELREHLNDLEVHARNLKRELTGLRDDQDAEARELKAELREVQGQMKRLMQEMKGEKGEGKRRESPEGETGRTTGRGAAGAARGRRGPGDKTGTARD
jgi:hypothetical protein